MKIIKLGFLATATLFSATTLLAQDPLSGDTIIPGTPSECRFEIAAYRDSVIRVAKETKTAVNNDSLKSQMSALAAACVGKFDIATEERRNLLDLGALYVGAGQSEGARQVFDRLINESTDDEVKAEAVVLAIEALRRAPVSDSGILWAEDYLPVVDAIENVPAQKFKARARLIGFYLGRDIDDKLLPTAAEMFELATQMNPDEQKVSAKEIASSISILASLHASNLFSDSAVALLQSTPKKFPAIENSLVTTLQPALDRYLLIGKKAPTLLSDKWLGDLIAVPSSSPTLLMFTANWCPSCKNSYASVKELSARYADKGLKTVLAVTLDGEFEGVEMTPAEEILANEKYFRERERLDFPIAIQEGEETVSESAPLRNRESFKVGGYPQFMVIDGNGIIQAIILGWDPYGNRERALTQALEQVAN